MIHELFILFNSSIHIYMYIFIFVCKTYYLEQQSHLYFNHLRIYCAFGICYSKVLLKYAINFLL